MDNLQAHYTVYSQTAARTIHKRNFDAPPQLPRFIWVYPDGTREGRDSKYLVDP